MTSQDHVEKALELERHGYTAASSGIERSVKTELDAMMARHVAEMKFPSSAASVPSYKPEVLRIRVGELESLLRERIKQRGISATHAPELLGEEYISGLRNELVSFIDQRCAQLKSLLPGGANLSFLSLSGSPRDDEAVRLKTLAESLIRTLQLEHEFSGQAGSPKESLIFISCGQFTEQEKRLGKQIAAAVSTLPNCKGYFAENQNSLLGLSVNIFKALDRASALIAVMHNRGMVQTPSGAHIRGSVWVEQEIAIASFLAHTRQDELPVLVYIQKGIEREGVRQQLRLAPVEFETEDEVLRDVERQIKAGTFLPRADSQRPPRNDSDAVPVGRPVLQLDLVDPETRQKFGSVIEVHPALFNLPDPESLPMYGKAPVDFFGTRLDMSTDNNDYYEDVANHLKLRGTYCGIGLSVSNSSSTFADTVVVTLELKSDGNSSRLCIREVTEASKNLQLRPGYLLKNLAV